MNKRLREIAHETVEIVDRGSYQASVGQVGIGDAVGRAVAGTRLHPPDEPLPEPLPLDGPPAVEVTNESSLTAARRLGEGTACLVFASARNPGGGFLNGAQAQEETIARASALYACLRAAPDFYAHHRSWPELTYSDRIIYSPGVPVFRDEEDGLLPEPYPVSFLTAAAPNRAAVARNQPERAAGIPAILLRRACRVLAVAATHGHRRLVLGAWGCGVFGNDPELVATTFATALADSPWFSHVTFAVLDRRPGHRTYTAFADALGELGTR
ncbi:TIGR02452 family protein [Amycolatopsis rhizosphaerae]|uniref:TIGR02452 family protein n=1 Tax=Amycolatopsis rhizosphaerae TaxID=2053003 RepID=A0A558B9L5_9PSEU|nr:TIGR02452 family protein [Amycolatopsis rhizosphaerae]TVT33203.1 TIGR02452 family protein [Amycolatopsis rhizosphaerae]